jgi:hypothetical protein
MDGTPGARESLPHPSVCYIFHRVTRTGAGLRLMLFDKTCRGSRFGPGLSHAWGAGSVLYRALRRLDASFGIDRWSDGLDWLVAQSHARGRPISEVQYWGHGRRGRAMVASEVLDRSALEMKHPLHAKLDALRKSLADDGSALWWWRTCETIGGREGHALARSFARFLGARVAGHTYVIGVWQSGLHELAPGADPHWSVREGFAPGDADADDTVALRSTPQAPNTIHCLQGTVPRGW